MCFVQSPVKNCTVHSSSLKKPLMAWHIWTCCNCDKCHSFKTYQRSYYSKTEVPPTSSVRLFSTWTQCDQDAGQGVHLEILNQWRFDPRGPLTLRPVIFFFGDMSKTGIRPIIATWLRWPKGTDHCSSEENQCTHVDVCESRTWTTCRHVVDTHGAHIEHF